MTVRSLKTIRLAIVLSLGALICLCAELHGFGLLDPTPSEAQSKRGMGHTVKLGAAISLTGSAASIGDSVRKGMALAQQEVNTKGLPKFIFRVEDTKSTVTGAVTAIKSLVEVHDVPVILGPIRSSATLAAAPIAEQNKRLLFSPASVADRISDAGEYIFRNRETARYHSIRAAELFVERQLMKVAVLAAQSDNSVSYVDYFRVTYGEKGGAIVYYGEYEEKASDVKTLILRAKDAGAEALYLVPTLGADAGLLVRQVREQQFNGPIVGNPLMETKEFLTSAGTAAEGVLYTYPAFDPTQGIGKKFARMYRKRFGKSPDAFAANAYDAVKIIAESVRACGNSETNCLRDHVLGIKNYNGAGGKTSFDENGDVVKPVLVKMIQGKKFVIAPKPEAQAEEAT